jgi:hypothetical protein
MGFKENSIDFMSGQIRVAANASDSYFENLVRSRLKELLITKISLETGLESDTVRRSLSDKGQGTELLHGDEFYRVLYGPIPGTPGARIQMVRDAIEMIGAWNG